MRHPNELIEACASAWIAEQGGRARDEAARALGLALDDAVADAIASRLAGANYERTKFTLTHEDVIRVMLDAIASPHGVAVRHGGRAGLHSGLVSTHHADDVFMGQR